MKVQVNLIDYTKTNSFLMFLSLFLFLHLIGRVSAATYYISPDGLDENLGTNLRPFKTIQKCADIVIAGDTCIVKDGNYKDSNNDKVVLKINRGGNKKSFITFKSQNKWGAVIDGGLNAASFGIQAGKDIGYVHIEGFEITEAANAGIHFPNYFSGNNWKIIKNNIHHIGLRSKSNQWEMDNFLVGHNGIYIGMNSSHFRVSDNVIHHIGRLSDPARWNSNRIPPYPQKHEYSHDQGIYIEEDVRHVNIINNTFYENHFGMHFKLSPGDSNIVVDSNIFYGANKNIDTHPWWGWGGSFMCWQGTKGLKNITVENNIFYNPTNGYIFRAYPEDGSGIVNFIFRNNKVSSNKILDTRITGTGFVVSNNSLNALITTSQCFDGIDNDKDGEIDFPLDSKCTSIFDNDEEKISNPEITSPKLINVKVIDYSKI